MAEVKETNLNLSDLPVAITQQRQDGCVTASARAIIPSLGINFDHDFLPLLQKYSLDATNSENNHMLGVAAVAANLGLDVIVHTRNPLQGDHIPDDVPTHIRTIHAQVIDELIRERERRALEFETGELDINSLQELLNLQLGRGKLALIFLDWKKWNAQAQAKFKNPRHIVALYKIDNETIYAIDPAVDPSENPVVSTTEKLFNSLNEKQQVIFIGRPKK